MHTVGNDAFTISKINLEGNQLKIVGERLTTNNCGIAVRLEDTELLNKFNQGLKTIKENGAYAEVYDKWFQEAYKTGTLQKKLPGG